MSYAEPSASLEKDMSRKIILLEANEIPSRVLDFYVTQNPESRLAEILPVCRRYETVAADTCPLSPWITWPTIHRGVNNDTHNVLHFGQDLREADAEYPPIWQILMEAGIRTGVFGPMHSSPLPANAGRFDFFVPDTFAHTPECHPAELTAFQDFNLSMARQSPRNVSRGIDFKTLASFLLRAPGLGLRPSTVFSLLGQLVDERRNPWKSTRRRTYQPVLAFDLFIEQLREKKPEFSNFFTNHVASAMHRYWAALFPEDYDDLELDEQWQQRYKGEIDFAMNWTDRFVDRLVRFANKNPEYLLVVASSMGQCASSGKRIDTQLYLRDPEAFLERAGISVNQWERRPAMDPTVSLLVSPDQARGFEQFLHSMTIQGQPVKFETREEGFFDLIFGQTDIDVSRDKLLIGGQETSYSAVGLELTQVEDEAGSTGYHIPEGILFVYDPKDLTPKPLGGAISTLDVAPALMTHFGVDVPKYMRDSSKLKLSAEI
jgi:hypothetical protein